MRKYNTPGKYNTPEIICRTFAAENIVTASNPEYNGVPSATTVKQKMQAAQPGLTDSNVITENWN